MAVVRIKHVAQRAGVSTGTVSNVLNQPDLVASTTRQRVLDAIEELGFIRNESARALRAGSSRIVALVVLDATNPFFADIARGAEQAADQHGSLLIVSDTHGDPKRERRILAQLEEQRVQGILITPVNAEDPIFTRARQRKIPVVFVDSRQEHHQHCAAAVEDVLGGRLAVDHLLARGHRRIWVAGGDDRLRQVRERREGARQASISASLTDITITTLDTTELSISAGREIGTQLVRQSTADRPTAVFCVNDLLALGLMQELQKANVKIPDDIAVVGYDDIEFASGALTPLTSLRQPSFELGRTAAELLFAEIADGDHHAHRQVTFQPVLMLRDSTQPTGLLR